MIFDEVKEILAQHLEINEEDIDLDSDIYDDLDAGKYDMVDIAMTVEEQYSIELSEEALEEISTVGDLVAYIENNID